MDQLESSPADAGSRLLSLDGSEAGTTEMSMLVLLNELMQRIENLEDLEETPPPYMYFDLIGGTGVGGVFAILFAAWRLTVEEAIEAYFILYEKVFTSEAWRDNDTEAAQRNLEEAIREIATTLDKDAGQMLGVKKGSDIDYKAFTCTLNPDNLTFSRLLCTYRARAIRNPKCTVAQTITAALAGHPHLDPVALGRPPEKFISGVQRVANPISILVSEAQSVFGSGQAVSCIVSLGAGHKEVLSVPTNGAPDIGSLAKLVSDAERNDYGVEKRFDGVKDFYFRLNVVHGLEDVSSTDALSAVTTHSKQYLSLSNVGKKLDKLVEAISSRPTTVTVGRLNSILGPDAQNQTLELVRGVDSGVRQICAIEQDDRFHDIITWLSPNQSFYGSLRECRQTRKEGTGLWLLESDEFRGWLNEDIRLLTLQGIPGGGKTILASIVYDYLHTTQSGDSQVILGAFITYGISTSIDDILACLLSQVLDDGTGRLVAEVEAIYKKRSYGRPLMDELLNALRARFSRATRVMIVLDALDEFPSEHRELLLLSLLGLSPNVKVLVTSRPLPQMQFEGLSASCIHIEESHQADLLFFVNQQMENNGRLRQIFSNRPDLSHVVLKSVLARCNGMFLLARFHMDELATYRTAIALENALPKLPTTASQKYATTLDRIGKQPERDGIYAMHTLMWMSLQQHKYSWHRFRINELILAVASSADELGDSVDKVTLTEQDLIEVCAGLVVVRDGYAEFVHLTAQEFFINYFGNVQANSAHFCAAQHELANGCLRYMLLPGTQEILRQIITSGQKRGNAEERFLRYSVLSIGRHMQYSESAEEITSRLFSDPHLYALLACFLLEEIQWEMHRGHVHWQKMRQMEPFNQLHWASYFGISSVCSSLIQSNNVNSRDMFGCSPLFYAAIEGHSTVVHLMLSQMDVEVNLRDKSGQSPLLHAVQRGKVAVVQLLLSRPDVEANSRDRNGRSPLSYAAEEGKLDVTQLLLSRTDVELNSRDNVGRTPLSRAAERGHLDVVQLLLSQKDAEVNSRDKFGVTPILYAAKQEHLDVVQLLLSRPDTEVNYRDKQGQSLLSYTARLLWGKLDIAQLLLSRPDVEVNFRNNVGRTPLSYATQLEELDVVQLLLSQPDVGVNSLDSYGRSPLSYAAEKGGLDVAQLLLSRPDVEADSRDSDGRSPLSYAAEEGKLDVAQLLLSRPDVEADSRDSDGRSPLSYSAEEGKLDVAQLLLSRPDVEADSRDSDGWSSLSYAANRGHLDIAQLLLSRPDVEANSRDSNGRSPLSNAVEWGNLDIAQLLLSRNDVEADSRDNKGHSPLSYAIKSRNVENTEEGSYVTTEDLDFLISTDIVLLLLGQTDVEVDLRDIDGRSPLSYAAEWGRLDIAQLLLSRPAVEVDSRDNDGRSPLSYASAEEDASDVVQLLLSRTDVEPDSKDNNGRSPLSYAAERGHLDVVQLLLSRPDVEKDSKDCNGRTPLSYAAEHGPMNVIKHCLDCEGVDMNSKDILERSVTFHVARVGIAAIQGYEILEFKEVLETLISCERFVLDVKTLVEVARFYKRFWNWQRNRYELPDRVKDEEVKDTLQADSEAERRRLRRRIGRRFQWRW